MKNKGEKIFFSFWGLFLFFLPIQATSFETQDLSRACLTGLVIDKQTKEPLTGATVQIEGTAAGTVTDIDGNFILPDLVSGNYKIQVKYISYTTVQLGPIHLSSGQKKHLAVEMTEAGLSLEGVVVVAPGETKYRACPVESNQSQSIYAIRYFGSTNRPHARPGCFRSNQRYARL